MKSHTKEGRSILSRVISVLFSDKSDDAKNDSHIFIKGRGGFLYTYIVQKVSQVRFSKLLMGAVIINKILAK